MHFLWYIPLLALIPFTLGTKCQKDLTFLLRSTESQIQGSVAVYFELKSKESFDRTIDYLQRLVEKSQANKWAMVAFNGPNEAKLVFSWKILNETVAQLDILKSSDYKEFAQNVGESLEKANRVINLEKNPDVVVLISSNLSCKAKKAFQLIDEQAANRTLLIISINQSTIASCTDLYLGSTRAKSVVRLAFKSFDDLVNSSRIENAIPHLYHDTYCRYMYEPDPDFECYYSKDGDCVRDMKVKPLKFSQLECPAGQVRVPCPKSDCAKQCEQWKWSDWSFCKIETNGLEKGKKDRWRIELASDMCLYYGCVVNEVVECDMKDQSRILVENNLTRFSCSAHYGRKNWIAVDMAVKLLAATAISSTCVALVYFLVERAQWVNKLFGFGKE